VNQPYKLVPKTDVKVTRPALERASWLCEGCRDDEDLRVVEKKPGGYVVLCSRCRLHGARMLFTAALAALTFALAACGGDPFARATLDPGDAQTAGDAADSATTTDGEGGSETSTNDAASEDAREDSFDYDAYGGYPCHGQPGQPNGYSCAYNWQCCSNHCADSGYAQAPDGAYYNTGTCL
jgi:hypothetical protein